MTARSLAAVGRPHRLDVLIAGGGLLGGLLLWAMNLHGGPARLGLPTSLTLVALTAMSAAELLRRTAPMTALAIAVPALVLDICTGALVATVLMFTDVVYAAVLYGPASAARRIPLHSVLVTVLAAIALTALWQDPQVVMAVIGIALVTIAPAWTGIITRNHRDAAQSARLRAERIALLAERDRTQAVAGERARMARELHDMVANHLSAIAIHSTAAQSIDDPSATREALGVIRENSVQGLAEMRRLIGLLRDPKTTETAEEPAATPTLDGLDALITQARANGTSSGLTFVLDDARSPDGQGAGRTLAAVELAAYRIVQESLTNALKHAAPGEVRVRIARERGGALTVAVRSPFADRPGPRAPGSGTGLVGMRERIALLGGAFEAGPESGPAGRVWLVRAVVPAAEEEEQR
ncbi:two-component sensor histidine kinase [Streptomyces inhibens]|uniref:histidine kinase n=1 Tax=Streptomyces inhibens TaxID=2293571 RepID=A0A371QA60_STRIH|nr:histidine kinase [Streptomyces inhibens]REK91564.1 two-component sensor histidine kinase [Streptomyces inhibens]